MGIEFGYNAVWDHSYVENTVENTTKAVRALYHNPEIAIEIAENAYEDFKDASGPERAKMISSVVSNLTISIALPNYGVMTKLGIFAKFHKVDLNISGKVSRVTEVKVYRVYGGEAKAIGKSWTPINPQSISNYRDVAGLPNVNSGRFIIEGTTSKSNVELIRKALKYDGNKGGLLEYIIRDPNKIKINNVSGVNPEF